MATDKDKIEKEKSTVTDETLGTIQDMERAVEAILFAAGYPVKYEKLSEVIGLPLRDMKNLVAHMADGYGNRGIQLLTFPDACQLCTKEHYLTEIRAALGIKKSGTLSTSSLEALAIVAYNQPVTRAFVDTLRRADSSYAMNNLIDRGLIECKGRLDVPGRPMLYGTTSDFLRCFGLENISNLPTTTEEITAMFQRVRNHENQEAPEENIEGGEQIAIADEILDEAKPLEGENDAVDAETVEEVSEPEEASEEDGDPSADDYQDLGE